MHLGFDTDTKDVRLPRAVKPAPEKNFTRLKHPPGRRDNGIGGRRQGKYRRRTG
jgi:hypothetical protein